ncbi:MAG TPA: hypothetical protein VGX94_03890 [Terriglobia bacterium]|nr:hypothetical protein [Terriglobia bacterium]
MAKRTAASKKQVILDCFREKGYQEAGLEELRALRAELQRRLGNQGNTSFPYIATVLEGAGVKVHYAGSFPSMPEPYASRLKGVLHFHDLAAAEASLRNLDAVYREYLAAHDHKGVSYVRSVVLQGKQRAEQLARSRRVSEAKRRKKQEITSWFRVWLETPDLFFDWLALRKQSREYCEHYGRT